eukprot:1288430-Rhodomonas_salina.1
MSRCSSEYPGTLVAAYVSNLRVLPCTVPGGTRVPKGTLACAMLLLPVVTKQYLSRDHCHA